MRFLQSGLLLFLLVFSRRVIEKASHVVIVSHGFPDTYDGLHISFCLLAWFAILRRCVMHANLSQDWQSFISPLQLLSEYLVDSS